MVVFEQCYIENFFLVALFIFLVVRKDIIEKRNLNQNVRLAFLYSVGLVLRGEKENRCRLIIQTSQ